MVRVAINGSEYLVSTSWEEADIDKLLACEDFKDELKCLTTLPHELIDKASMVQLWPVYTCLSFIDDVEAIEPLPALSVEDAPYEQIELAKTFMSGLSKPYKKILNAARVYYPGEKNTVQLIRLGVSIVSQIAVFLKYYQSMNKDKPTFNEQIAGVEELGKFGSWGTVYNLANRDITKMEEIFKMPAIKVYTTLFYSWKESQYQKKLFELNHPPK